MKLLQFVLFTLLLSFPFTSIAEDNATKDISLKHISSEEIIDYFDFANDNKENWPSIIRKGRAIFSPGSILPKNYKLLLSEYIDRSSGYNPSKYLKYRVIGEDRNISFIVNKEDKSIKSWSGYINKIPIHNKGTIEKSDGGPPSEVNVYTKIVLTGVSNTSSTLKGSSAKSMECDSDNHSKYRAFLNSIINIPSTIASTKKVQRTQVSQALEYDGINNISHFYPIRCATISYEGFTVTVSHYALNTNSKYYSHELLLIEIERGDVSSMVYTGLSLLAENDNYARQYVYAIADVNNDEMHDIIVDDVRYGGNSYNVLTFDTSGNVIIKNIIGAVSEM